jgi:hypothetical protein
MLGHYFLHKGSGSGIYYFLNVDLNLRLYINGVVVCMIFCNQRPAKSQYGVHPVSCWYKSFMY